MKIMYRFMNINNSQHSMFAFIFRLSRIWNFCLRSFSWEQTISYINIHWSYSHLTCIIFASDFVSCFLIETRGILKTNKIKSAGVQDVQTLQKRVSFYPLCRVCSLWVSPVVCGRPTLLTFAVNAAIGPGQWQSNMNVCLKTDFCAFILLICSDCLIILSGL